MKSAESARGELQSQVLQLEDTVERQQRFISRLEEERDRCNLLPKNKSWNKTVEIKQVHGGGGRPGATD